MSFPHAPDLHNAKSESLQTQQEYLNLLRLRHLQWMHSTNNPQVKRMHQKVAELIEQIADQYTQLRDTLRE